MVFLGEEKYFLSLFSCARINKFDIEGMDYILFMKGNGKRLKLKSKSVFKSDTQCFNNGSFE